MSISTAAAGRSITRAVGVDVASGPDELISDKIATIVPAGVEIEGGRGRCNTRFHQSSIDGSFLIGSDSLLGRCELGNNQHIRQSYANQLLNRQTKQSESKRGQFRWWRIKSET